MSVRGYVLSILILLLPASLPAQQPTILYVGVRQLPEFLSPATAVTDSEQQAVELLFRSLVRPEFEPGVGQRYYPGLAAELPALAPLGREFRLDEHAKWADGSRVLAVDVRRTVDLLREARQAPLIDEARVGNDPYHVTLAMDRSYFEPLALMSFKVLPKGLAKLDDEKFAHNPLGNGPYAFAGRLKEKNREVARFTASKHFHWPEGKPAIDEIRFYVPKDPAAELASGTLHVWLDADAGKGAHALPARRVYFLAANQRKPFLQSRELRRCLALAIDRVGILKEVFGDAKGYRQLTGPFPADSWAANPKLTPLFNAESAAALAVKAKAALGAHPLTLKYPDGDPRVQRACAAIRAQVQERTGIELQLVALTARQLHDDVVGKHDYDLAYFQHDFLDEAAFAWPLFDPAATAKGGSNYLGVDDADLRKQFGIMFSTREFGRVQAASHLIHDLVHDRVPLIPLWQLEMNIALGKRVKPFPEAARLDPLRVFMHVERWSLTP